MKVSYSDIMINIENGNEIARIDLMITPLGNSL